MCFGWFKLVLWFVFVRKFFNFLSCYVCVRKNILTLPFVFVYVGCVVVLAVIYNDEQFV